MGSEDEPQQNADSEELSDRSWNGHRKRQLIELGVDPEDPDV